MSSCSEMRILLCLLLVLGSCSGWRTEYTETGQNEGDICHKENGEEWTCKNSSDCERLREVLKTNGRLKTCSWKGKTPVLCCPPKRVSEQVKHTRSEQKCAEYSKRLCGQQEYIFLQSLPAAPQRKRRQVDQPQTMNVDASPPPPMFEAPPGIVGGHVTESGELSSMIQNSPARNGSEYLDLDDAKIQVPILAVVGGRLTQSAEFPSAALIGYGDEKAINWQCGGSLISEEFVLSAAHCVNTPYGLARWVRVGDRDLLSDYEDARPQQREIIERVVHPGYRSPAFYNDLALFRLSRPVELDRFVRPACLHTDTEDPRGYGTAAGWGTNETNGLRQTSLMQVDISFVPSDKCKQLVGIRYKYLPNGTDPETMVCAGEPGKDTCSGDSGGPLVLPATPWSSEDCLARLVGVTSFGPKLCGRSPVPGVYVRVPRFLSWIESVVWPE